MPLIAHARSVGSAVGVVVVDSKVPDPAGCDSGSLTLSRSFPLQTVCMCMYVRCHLCCCASNSHLNSSVFAASCFRSHSHNQLLDLQSK